jgi:hypothetical protein
MSDEAKNLRFPSEKLKRLGVDSGADVSVGQEITLNLSMP